MFELICINIGTCTDKSMTCGLALKHSVYSGVKLIVFQPKTKFFEGTKSNFEKIKNLHQENIARKVCTKFGEARSNGF